MKIPIHYKQKNFSCGPAALRMAVQALINKDASEDIFIEFLGTSEEAGTLLLAFKTNLSQMLQIICNKYGIENHFESVIKENSCFKNFETLAWLPKISARSF